MTVQYSQYSDVYGHQQAFETAGRVQSVHSLPSPDRSDNVAATNFHFYYPNSVTVCLVVYLSASKITRKLADGFTSKF